MDANTTNGERAQITIKLWPPSQNTRNMLIERMTNNLSTPTIFTRKYGSLSTAGASKHAKQIEESAFAAANLDYEQKPDGDGSSAVQLYAREASKLILDVLKGLTGPTVEESGSIVEGSGPTVEESGPTVEDSGPTVEDVKMTEIGSSSTFQETVFDISKGKRAFIEEDEAKNLLGPLKELGNSYTKICFSNRSFGLDAAQVAGPILASIKAQLKEVDLSDFVAGRPEEEALKVMNIFSEALEGSNLKYLNISENALGEKGVRAFGKLLKSQADLEELYLMNDGISKEAAQAIRELVPSTDNLRVLHFHNNMTGDEGAIAISEIVARCPLLENFRCSSTRVGAEGGIALSESLGKCLNLKKIDIQDNMFGVEAGLKLSEALYKHEHLSEINLSYLNLEDDGAVAIANALKDSAPLLTVLEMAGNDITAEGALSLSDCVATKKGLVKLNLAENELKDDGVVFIGKAIGGLDQIKVVDLSQNSVRAAAKDLARSLVGLPEFEFLNVDGNVISDKDVEEIKAVFKECPEKLGSFDENDPDGYDDEEDVGEGGKDELEDKFKNLGVNEGDD